MELETVKMDENNEPIVEKNVTVDNGFNGDFGLSDLTLIIEQTKIRVSKVVLCLASPVFRAMLEGEFKEKNEEEIELPGKKYTDMVEFLCCIYPNKLEYVTGKNVYRVLPLASEYQVEILQERCHRILVEIVKSKHRKNVQEIFRHLQLAELYQLDSLRDKCTLIASEFKLAEIRDAHKKYPVPDILISEIKDFVIQRYELNATDDRYLWDTFGPKKCTLREAIRQAISSARYNGENTEKYRARRLYARYFPAGDAELLGAVKKQETFSFDSTLLISSNTLGTTLEFSTEEQFKLLPEEFKQKLELEICTDKISKILSESNV